MPSLATRDAAKVTPSSRLIDKVFLSHLEKDIETRLLKISRDADASIVRVARRICLTIQGLSREIGVFGDVCLFGSFQNGFNINASDLDLSISANLGHDDALLFLQCLSRLLPNFGFDNLTCVLLAHVPLIKFTDTKCGIEVDLCVNNDLGVRNSKLLHTYGQYDTRVLQLGRLVKLWAKGRELVGTADGCLNSYAFILLVLYFLLSIDPPVVPNLQQLGQSSAIVKDKSRGCDYWWETKFEDDMKLLPATANAMSIAELLIRFFMFFSEEFDWSSHAVCMRLGGPGLVIDKFSLLCSTSADAWYIEDPFDLKRNLAGNSCTACRSRILNEMRSSLDSICAMGVWSEACFTAEMNTFFLKCSVGQSTSLQSMFFEFEDSGFEKIHFPRHSTGGRSKIVFIEFDNASSRRRALAKNEFFVSNDLIKLQSSTRLCFAEANSEDSFMTYEFDVLAQSLGLVSRKLHLDNERGGLSGHAPMLIVVPAQQRCGDEGKVAMLADVENCAQDTHDAFSDQLRQSPPNDEVRQNGPETQKTDVHGIDDFVDNSASIVKSDRVPTMLSKILDELTDPDKDVRQKAVVGLASDKRFTKKSGGFTGRARSAVGALLKHSDWNIRQTAVRALVHLTEKGNRRAILNISACLTDSSRGVRRMAVHAMGQLTLPGDLHTIQRICACLTYSQPEVRCSALKALAQVSGKGIPQVVEAVSARTKDPASSVRSVAVFVLAVVAEADNVIATDAVCTCLVDTIANVRRAALQVLGTLVQKHNARAMTSIISLLHHAAPIVRKFAVKALAQVAVKGDLKAIGTVVDLLDYCDGKLQSVFLNTLAMVADKGDKCALAGVRERLRHVKAEVRRVAVMAIQVLSEKNDARAIGSLCGSLRDSDCHVRHTAVMALEQLADKDDARVAIAASSHLQRISGRCKEAGHISDMGDWRSLAMVSARLQNADTEVRSEAVQALIEIADPASMHGQGVRDNSRLVRRMMDTRMAALDALALFAENGNVVAIAALTVRLQDSEPCVRHAATCALERSRQNVDADAG